MKLVKIEITPALTHIINLSIQTSTFPTLWKHAKVIPLLKPGSEDQLMPKSYRPVALLSVLSKVLERAIFMQTVQYMNEQNLMHPYHHGFRTDHSTTTAMLQMYDLWVGAANRGELAGVAMIDQSAAFDCVDHPLLIEKLKLYGWDDMSLEWTKNYLSSRSQSCSVESFVSEPLPVSFGVPQGSILGPLYFCIFTNDFPECVHQSDCPHKFQENDGGSMFNLQCQKCGTVTVYADDSTYTITDTDPIRLSRKLSQKFDVMAEYLTANKLKVNNDKTHLMLMCTDQRRRKQTSTLKVMIGSTEIEVSQTERLLGAYIHQNMKWVEHIRNNKFSLIHSLNSRIGALKKVAKVASFKTRLSVANGIFMSKLNFMIPLWAGCAEYLASALQVCQNHAARIVTKHDKNIPVKQLLNECGWRSVRQEMYYHTAVLVHRIITQRRPTYLYSQLTADGSHGYQTRSSTTSNIRQSTSFNTSLTLCKESFKWRGAACYEGLPGSIRSIKNIKLFKKELDSWVRNNIPQ